MVWLGGLVVISGSLVHCWGLWSSVWSDMIGFGWLVGLMMWQGG